MIRSSISTLQQILENLAQCLENIQEKQKLLIFLIIRLVMSVYGKNLVLQYIKLFKIFFKHKFFGLEYLL